MCIHTCTHTQLIGIYIDTITPYIKKSKGMKNIGVRVIVTICDERQVKELIERLVRGRLLSQS